MKLKLTLTAVLMLSAAAAGEASAQCAVQPSCASLGYTLTSTSNCIGAVLRCPFDTSRLYCTQKSEVLNQIKLNWSARTVLNEQSYYYVPKNGVIMGTFQDRKNIGSFIKINGYEFGTFTGLEKQRGFVYANVSQGDSVFVNAGWVYVYFIPYSGI